MNKISLTGRLARDPKIHKAPDNQSVVSNTLAVRKFSPTEKNAVDWFNFEAWNDQAEYIARHCKKGSLLAIEGFVRVQSYTTRNGEPRKKFFVNVVRAESDND